MDNESPKTIDWLAIRAAYETGVEPLRHIARLHGVSESVVHRKRTKEAWPRRHETGRIAPRPAPNTNQVDWLAVRHLGYKLRYQLIARSQKHVLLARPESHGPVVSFTGEHPDNPRLLVAVGSLQGFASVLHGPVLIPRRRVSSGEA